MVQELIRLANTCYYYCKKWKIAWYWNKLSIIALNESTDNESPPFSAKDAKQSPHLNARASSNSLHFTFLYWPKIIIIHIIRRKKNTPFDCLIGTCVTVRRTFNMQSAYILFLSGFFFSQLISKLIIIFAHWLKEWFQLNVIWNGCFWQCSLYRIEMKCFCLQE